MNEQLAKEVDELLKEFRQIARNAKRGTSAILTKSAKPVVAALYRAAPHGRKVHKRYSTAKLVKSIRAPKGRGNVVATYYPGNLAASFDVLRFRQSKYAVFVGAKLAKGTAQGVFGPFGKTDGYYAHMIEKGTRHTPPRPFILPTWIMMKERTQKTIVEGLKAKIKRLKKVQ